MSTPLQATPQIEADKRFVKFDTYERYLDSLITQDDHCYLQSTTISRILAELGYRSSGETLTRAQFERRSQAVLDYLYPKFKPYTMVSENVTCPDQLHRELAVRERPIRLGIMSTIIFVRHFTKTGFEISGYIDFGDRLEKDDLGAFFRGEKLMLPRPSDLGYYHWRTNTSYCNDSLNFKALIDPKHGLLFQNRFDRKVICVDPLLTPGNNSVRMRIQTDLYENAIIYDHLVMQRI